MGSDSNGIEGRVSGCDGRKSLCDAKEKMVCDVRSATQARVFGSLLCCFERVAQATKDAMNSSTR